MNGVIPLEVVHGVLTLALGGVTIGVLKTLQKLERGAPPLGARRVSTDLAVGDDFPLGYFPGPLGRRLEKGRAVLVYGSSTCGLCRSLVKAIPAFSKVYPEVEFVLFSETEWNPYGKVTRDKVSLVGSKPLVHELGLVIEPFAFVIQEGRVADFGVVNSAEHLESLLESKRRAP